jgi:hypothetical protein
MTWSRPSDPAPLPPPLPPPHAARKAQAATTVNLRTPVVATEPPPRRAGPPRACGWASRGLRVRSIKGGIPADKRGALDVAGGGGPAAVAAVALQNHQFWFDSAPNQSAKIMAAMPRGDDSSTIRRTNQGKPIDAARPAFRRTSSKDRQRRIAGEPNNDRPGRVGDERGPAGKRGAAKAHTTHRLAGGSHRKSVVKADTKVLSGISLEPALNPLDERTFTATSARASTDLPSKRLMTLRWGRAEPLLSSSRVPASTRTCLRTLPRKPAAILVAFAPPTAPRCRMSCRPSAWPAWTATYGLLPRPARQGLRRDVRACEADSS